MKASLSRVFLLGAVCVIASVLGGCAATTIVHDYSSFSSAYARDMNWQILMNLARLDQGHPPYFVAIGEFKMNRVHTASVGLDRTHSSAITDVTTSVPPGHTIVDTLSKVWRPSATTQVSPQMSFIPMNSDETTKQLLQPVPTELFFLLYQQGWRVDHLLRVLVDRVEFKGKDGEAGTYYNNGVVGGDVRSYERFLCYADTMRNLQEKRELSIQSTSPVFQPLGSPTSTPPTAEDINAAAAQGRVWQINPDPKNPSTWLLGTIRTGSQLVPTKWGKTELEKIHTSGYPAEEPKPPSVVAYGLVSSPTAEAPQEGKLILRSFRSILENLATEQQYWMPPSAMKVTVGNAPARQQRPILRFAETKAAFDLKPEGESVHIKYAGGFYGITDDANPDPRWNRDVFRLVVQLSSQVTVDISKFQRTVLQIGP